MAVTNDPRLELMNRKLNTVVGLKQYRQVKKVMEDFDAKLHQELEKNPKVDRQIK